MAKTRKPTLWTRNYILLIAATTCGCIGGIAGSFALSFLVFDETGSTLAAALLIALQVIPSVLIPLVAAPIMDRLPRKPLLVLGDVINGVLYTLAGLYLLYFEFNYTGYLVFSLVLSSLGTFDDLAYTSLYPKLIPKGFENQGYTVSGMLYPVLRVVMAPVAAWLYGAVGVAAILIIQGVLCFAAAAAENLIRLEEDTALPQEGYSLRLWWQDIKEAAAYLKNEPGLRDIYAYMALSNGIGNGYYPLLTAFFRTAAGFTIGMYSFFSVAEFAGRSLGGMVHYHVKIPAKRRFGFAAFVYVLYELMDTVLLWLPYPLMLANRALCGFLGINSATLRETAVQGYIPEQLRARLNAFCNITIQASIGIFSLLIGTLGEFLPYHWCMSICGLAALFSCCLTVLRGRKHVAPIYNRETDEPA